MATKVRVILRDPPHSSEAFLGDHRHEAPDGWQVERDRLPVYKRFTKIHAGLTCSVTDYGESVHWRVFCELDGVPIIAHGQESNLAIAVPVVENAAERLRWKECVPRRAEVELPPERRPRQRSGSPQVL